MTPQQITSASKFLSLILRHQPEAAGVSPDAAGWVDVEALLAGCARAGRSLTRRELEHLVATNAKQRFEFSPDGARIRASQGHSIDVELGYEPAVPPELLYHGTATRFLDAIHSEGLRKMSRHHVHLSTDPAATMQVGARHGKPALLTIRAGDMHRAGLTFFLATNGVWLVDAVPVAFIQFP